VGDAGDPGVPLIRAVARVVTHEQRAQFCRQWLAQFVELVLEHAVFLQCKGEGAGELRCVVFEKRVGCDEVFKCAEVLGGLGGVVGVECRG
jgi:hypothetical protein